MSSGMRRRVDGSCFITRDDSATGSVGPQRYLNVVIAAMSAAIIERHREPGVDVPAPPTVTIRRLHALDDAHVESLADLLVESVDAGASVGFMHPLSREKAVTFWRRVAEGVSAGERALLVAEDAAGTAG